MKGRRVAADSDTRPGTPSPASASSLSRRRTPSISLTPARTATRIRTRPATKMIDIDGTAWTPMSTSPATSHRVAVPARHGALRGALRQAERARADHRHRRRPRHHRRARGGQPRIARHRAEPAHARTSSRSASATTPGGSTAAPASKSSSTRGGAGSRADDETFDVIQLSLIDTFALNAAGGFVFSENYLYTVEAFREYYRHLTPDGVLSITRYFVGELSARDPARSRRWCARRGPRRAWPTPPRMSSLLAQGVNATMLAKRTPFTPEELRALDAAAARTGITILSRAGRAGRTTTASRRC